VPVGCKSKKSWTIWRLLFNNLQSL